LICPIALTTIIILDWQEAKKIREQHKRLEKTALGRRMNSLWIPQRINEIAVVQMTSLTIFRNFMIK